MTVQQVDFSVALDHSKNHLCVKLILNLHAGLKESTSAEGMFSAAQSSADIPCMVPHERWSVDSYFAPEVAVNKMYVRHAGFLQGVQNFDASVFR